MFRDSKTHKLFNKALLLTWHKHLDIYDILVSRRAELHPPLKIPILVIKLPFLKYSKITGKY